MNVFDLMPPQNAVQRLVIFIGGIVCLLNSSLAFAEDNTGYSTKNIPSGLSLRANYIVRESSTIVDIFSPQDVVIREHYVITVFNDKGDAEADHAEYSSQLTSIESLSGCIYDGDGEVVRKIKKSDFSEVPASFRAGEFSDAKFKVYHVAYRQYPYTVEYTIKTRQNHTFYLPVWQPQAMKQCAVQSAELVVTVPDSIHLKYKQFNFLESPVISVRAGAAKQYKWSMQNIYATKPEPMCYVGSYTTPTIIFAIDKFMLDDYEGSTSSWADFGAFVFRLNKGRDSLPDDVKSKIKQMVASASVDREKIKILYEYLQKTMRYISITYGIGGWQTLDATFLSKNQYGDCKALSNYMMAMLQVVDITSYPVLINAGTENHRVLNADFVCSQFNHCILCVPSPKDTIWLECTSSDLPVNYLSDFTQNREALMITPAGGVLVHTPVYDTSVNLVSHHASIACKKDGKLQVDMANIYSGEPAEHLYSMLTHSNDHEKEEFLHSKFHLSAYSLSDYKYTKIDAVPVTCIRENASLIVSNMFSKTGDRSFVVIDVAPDAIMVTEQEGPRETSFHIPQSTAISDTFEMEIPAQNDVEFLPAPVQERYPFGSFFYVVNKEPGKLVMVRKITLINGTYGASQYVNYIKLVAAINKASRQKIVFKNKV